jgi:hypothetical protein
MSGKEGKRKRVNVNPSPHPHPTSHQHFSEAHHCILKSTAGLGKGVLLKLGLLHGGAPQTRGLFSHFQRAIIKLFSHSVSPLSLSLSKNLNIQPSLCLGGVGWGGGRVHYKKSNLKII